MWLLLVCSVCILSSNLAGGPELLSLCLINKLQFITFFTVPQRKAHKYTNSDSIDSIDSRPRPRQCHTLGLRSAICGQSLMGSALSHDVM